MLNKQIRAAQTNEVRAHNSVRLCAQLFREQNTQSQLKCLPILQDDYHKKGFFIDFQILLHVLM